MHVGTSINPLSADPAKWPNTLKQFVGNLPTNCLSVFGHFVGLALKGLIYNCIISQYRDLEHINHLCLETAFERFLEDIGLLTPKNS